MPPHESEERNFESYRLLVRSRTTLPPHATPSATDPRNAFPPLRAHRPRPPPAYCLSASRADLDRPLPHALTTQLPLASSLYFPCPLLPRSHPHAARMFSSLPRRRLLTVPHSPRSAWSAAAFDFEVIRIVAVNNQASVIFFQFFVHSFPSIASC